MEQVEIDRQKVFDLARPILERFKEYKEKVAILEKHLESLKLVCITSSEAYDILKQESDSKPLNEVQDSIIQGMVKSISDFKENHGQIISSCDNIRSNHKDKYMEYGKCISKLDRFNITISEKQKKDKPVSKSESEQIVMIVSRMQDRKASLDLCSAECHEKLNDLQKKQKDAYDQMISEFSTKRIRLFRRSAENLYSGL